MKSILEVLDNIENIITNPMVDCLYFIDRLYYTIDRGINTTRLNIIPHIEKIPFI
jgi:hypothetical protein